LLTGLTSHIDVQALDVALEFRRDGVEATFVRLDATDGAHHLANGRAICAASLLHAELLDFFGAQSSAWLAACGFIILLAPSYTAM
jgi:hypothetical protein